VGSSKKRTFNEGNNAAGSRTIPVHNAKVHRKSRKAKCGSEDILKRETSKKAKVKKQKKITRKIKTNKQKN
jgi:hypothetical protein